MAPRLIGISPVPCVSPVITEEKENKTNVFQ